MSQETDPLKLIGTRALAASLNCHPKTIEKMAREDKIPYFRVGPRFKYNEQEVMDHLRAKPSDGKPK